MDISFTRKEARLHQQTGKVTIPKQLVDALPTRILYATVQYSPEGNYVACLSALPNADAIPFFQEREIGVNGRGEGIITLGDLCEEAGIGGDLEALYFSHPPRWESVPHVLEFWDKLSLEKHVQSQLIEAPETNGPRCIWTYQEQQKSF